MLLAETNTKLIRVLFFSDTHLGFDYSSHPRNDNRRRGSDFFNNYHLILNRAIEESTDLIIHGGDLLYRSKVSDKILEKAYQPLLSVAKRNIPICIIPGNHELSRLPDKKILEYAGIHVFDQSRTKNISINNINISISGIPFIRNDVNSRFSCTLEDLRPSIKSADIRICCLHQAIQGARVGRHNYEFKNGADVIQLKNLPSDYHVYLSGHIHRHQQLFTNERIPVIYSGSIERTSIAEANEEKGFCWLEFRLQNEAWELVDIRFEPLPTRPMIELKIDPKLNNVKDIVSFIQSQIPSIPNNAVIRVVLPPDLNNDQLKQLSIRKLRSIFSENSTVTIRRRQFKRKKSHHSLRLFDYDLYNRHYQISDLIAEKIQTKAV